MDSPTIEVLAQRFADFAATSTSPLYRLLSASAALDRDVIELLTVAPSTQQIPVLLFAAVHDLLLGSPDLELARWYPSVSGIATADGDPYPAFAATCREHADALRHTIATRVTQTNDVGRCAYFVLALGLLDTGPISLVDIGASAGLNLNIDRYAYAYSPGGAVGAPSPLVIDTATRGPVPVPATIPTIAWRIGLDRQPVDLADPAAARWLVACVWPDQTERLERLRAAIELARAHAVTVRTGDAVEDIEAVVREAAGAGHPVVTNSWVLNYLSASDRGEYVARLDALGAETDLSWIIAEAPDQCPDLPIPDASDVDPALTTIALVTWRGGRRSARLLATAHPHGRWIHWRA